MSGRRRLPLRRRGSFRERLNRIIKSCKRLRKRSARMRTFRFKMLRGMSTLKLRVNLSRTTRRSTDRSAWLISRWAT